MSRVEGLLLQAQKKLRENDYEAAVSLLGEVYTLLPHKMKVLRPDAKLISQKLDLCQVMHMDTSRCVTGVCAGLSFMCCSINHTHTSNQKTLLMTLLFMTWSYSHPPRLRLFYQSDLTQCPTE